MRILLLDRNRACQTAQSARDIRRSIRQCESGMFGLWLSLVERLVRDQEAVGSNPTSPICFARSKAFRALV